MKKTLCTYFLFYSCHTFCQLVSGTIVDEANRAMSYVNVYNIRTQQGLYSNDEGGFILDEKKCTLTDEILFSHLGYEEVRMKVHEIAVLKTPIQLKSKDYNLKEVEVKPIDAKNILREVIAKASENYPTTFTKHEISFKDYSKISNKKNHYYYFHYNTWIPSYQHKKNDLGYSQVLQHELYNSGDGMFDFNGMSPAQLMLIMYPNELFKEEELAKHDYQLLSSIYYEGEELDVISVRDIPKKKGDFAAVEGKIYLTKNKAIRMIEVHIYNTTSKRFFLVAKMDSLNVNVKVIYKPVGKGKYVLDYISQTTYASGKLLGKSMNLNYYTTAKVLSTGLDISDNKIPKMHQVEDVLKEEKAKPIEEMQMEPDMK